MTGVLDAAIAAHRSGNVETALTIALTGLQAVPDNAPLLHFLGMIESRSGCRARARLINGLFPSAKFLFSLRHPCDVVLSCFITRFRLNWAVASF